jgi:hypothetical protein
MPQKTGNALREVRAWPFQITCFAQGAHAAAEILLRINPAATPL